MPVWDFFPLKILLFVSEGVRYHVLSQNIRDGQDELLRGIQMLFLVLACHLAGSIPKVELDYLFHTLMVHLNK